MKDQEETVEQKRERLRQQEMQRNPTGIMNDSINSAYSGNLHELVRSLGWKGAGILLLVVVMALIIVTFIL
ncbi:DUF6366 family protein [Cytobacillus gottheilii]|uniref:Phage capsid protein n=1 Tax=Cytobacillus gottheilii TaxID=859144 RepID=A0ABX8FHG5_9BACI|nr:DUF6366 family protein [Cytobacillus gottheilii]QVY63467.1 hypothetical protein J1899_10630 [Cytobacillus gottheilii]